VKKNPAPSWSRFIFTKDGGILYAKIF